ncbi:MAG: Gfo/Idh/MocA family protein [Planctomycetota bacterium]|jgi:predicted dehydrogenase
MAKKSKIVRVAVIGVGGMGNSHVNNLAKDIEGGVLAAVCDTDKAIADDRAKTHGVPAYYSHKDLLKAKVCDAVVIATPHYDHTTIGIDALKAGYHVLVEKPISVHKADCEKLIAAHKGGKKQVFAAMFNLRTDPLHQKVKTLIDNGELGKITRVNWIITNWFRTQAYYDGGGWRATWEGEGGGVLLNQCPHQLDLLQWFTGMPVKVRGFCGIAKSHNIEVEDEVTAYLEYKNGATGVFITSTGEAPGTNRLEIVGTQGKLVMENGKLTFTRNEIPMDTFCKTSEGRFSTPEVWNIEIPAQGAATQHRGIIQNFVNAIAKGETLIAPAREGINSVELGNAMLSSSLLGKEVEMPLNGKKFAAQLKKLIRESTFVKKKATKKANDDFAASFSKK